MVIGAGKGDVSGVWTRGRPFSFGDDSCFPVHFGFVQWQSNIKNAWIPVFTGMTGERRDGFPLPDRGRGQASRE